jgi:sigma-B regulation protein RsbU (phosphoserine phosphatase)
MTLEGKSPDLTAREKHLQRRIKELTTLYEVSKILTSALSLDKALKAVVETTARMMGVKACGLRLLDASTGEMVLKAVHGLSQEYIHKGRVFVWKGVYKDVIFNGNAAIVSDVSTDPRFEYTEEAVAEGIKSMLSVGLMVQDRPIGALSVYTDRHHLFTRDQIRIFKGIANEAASVIERSMLYEERMENQRIEQELSAASRIQANLMPQRSPELPGYQIAARNVPSRMVGGDFYDFITFDESHLGLVIADVSGKGIPGAILMASARASLRAYLEDPHSVGEVITRLNRILCRDTQPDQFVSLFYGMLDTADGTITYTNAGHNAPVVFRGNERILLEQGGPILGVLSNALYEDGIIQLLEGDMILFYTDGITEAERNARYFGVERLMEIVQGNMSKSPDGVIETVFDEVVQFSSNSPQSDDRTLVVLKRLE